MFTIDIVHYSGLENQVSVFQDFFHHDIRRESLRLGTETWQIAALNDLKHESSRGFIQTNLLPID